MGRPPETGLARRVTRSTSLPRYHKRKVIVNPGKLRFYTIGLLILISHIARCIGFLNLDSPAPRAGEGGDRGEGRTVSSEPGLYVMLRTSLKAYMAYSSAAGRPLSKPTTAARSWPWERVFTPHTCRSQHPSGSAQLGGYLPLAPGVSTVRYPIPERIFDYVSTVQSATAGTCQEQTSIVAIILFCLLPLIEQRGPW